MNRCPSCSAEQSESSKFCSECGVVLTSRVAATVSVHVQGDSSSRPSPSSDSAHHGRFVPGSKVADRYRIVSLLGQGGMGEVYRADDLKLGHTVALKFLPADLASDPKRLDYFLSEVRLTRQISHPNVCRVYDIGEVDGQNFLSMEYIDGEDLRILLRRIGRLPTDKGVQIAQQLCAGLSAAHERGVLHRDLKPANVMIDGRGQVRITDFGLARLSSDNGDNAIVGTPAYMAPEQLALGKTTIQSDLYSLGLVLYELFCGEPVNKSNSPAELLRQHQESSISQPSAVQGDIDPMVERTILRCLEKEAFQRPKSAHEVAASLPGGDPLAVALAAGETPSPEMVAAAGESSGLSKRTAVLCLLLALIGLLLNLALGTRSGDLSHSTFVYEPAVLADEARQIVTRDFGYEEPATPAIYGIDRIRALEGMRLGFWYRQRPDDEGFSVSHFWSDWGQYSRSRPTFRIPSWTTPGEYGLRLTDDKRLVYFRAIPARETVTDEAAGPPRWSAWFRPETTGYYLSGSEDQGVPPVLADDITVLEAVTDRWRTLPDANDHIGVWHGINPETDQPIYVMAAAFRGQPTYFRRFSEAEFDAASGNVLPVTKQWGRVMLISLYAIVLIGGILLAWQNYRCGRGDRRGSLRLVAYVFLLDVVVWLTFSRHTSDVESEIANVFIMGVSQVLFEAARCWVCYMALEPHVRRVWPHILISSSRLIGGRYRDPLVGRDLLFGISIGVCYAFVFRLQFFLQSTWGVTELPIVGPDPMTLSGLPELVGTACDINASAVFVTMFILLLLVICRMALISERRATLCCFAILVVINTLVWEGTPQINWIAACINAGLVLTLLVRCGALSAMAFFTAYALVFAFPLTLDATRWYFGHGMLAVVLILAALAYGFYVAVGLGRTVAASASGPS